MRAFNTHNPEFVKEFIFQFFEVLIVSEIQRKKCRFQMGAECCEVFGLSSILGRVLRNTPHLRMLWIFPNIVFFSQ